MAKKTSTKRKSDEISEKHPDGNPPMKTYDFTCFWESEEEYGTIVATLKVWCGDATRLQACKEICPESKREHLQCKITWKYAKRWDAMKKLLAKHHFEESVTKCFAYCAKMDSKLIITHDTRAPGQRSDLIKMKQMIDEGATEEDLWEEFFGSMTRYSSAMKRYIALKGKKKRRPKLQVEWYIGASGAGKSTKADELYPDAYWVNVDGTGNVWWDDYDGEEVVVIDDFRPNMFRYEQLLKLLNSRGKYRIAYKGGSSWLHCKKVVITSVEHPSCMYSMYDEQLARRITRFVVVEKTESVTVTEVK